MKKAAIPLAAVLICALLFSAPLRPSPLNKAVPVWTEVGPPGGEIRGLAWSAAAPGEMFAAAKAEVSQVFRSTDNGVSWKRTAFIADYTHDIAVHPRDPNIIYVLGAESFFRSGDRGSTFTACAYPKGIQAAEGQLAVNLADPEILYAAGETLVKPSGERLALLKSSNGGRTWSATKLDAAADWVSPRGIALSVKAPGTIYICGFIHKDKYLGRVLKSVNGGTTWTSVTTPQLRDVPYIYAVAVDPADKNRVFLATYKGVARSADGGATWTLQTDPASFHAESIAVDPSNSKILYAQSGNWIDDRGCYKSGDGGITWKKYASGVYGGGLRILVSGKRIWLGSNAGLFRSDNGGVSFSPSQAGITAAHVDRFALAPSAPKTIYAEAGLHGCFKTRSGGASWIRCGTLARFQGIDGLIVHPSDPQTIYLLSWQSGEDDLYKSSNGGTSFKSLLRKDINGIGGDPGDGDRLALAGRIYKSDWLNDPSYFGIYLTEDGGASGTTIKIRNDDGSEAQAVAFAPSDKKTIYVGGFTASRQVVLYKTSDGGTTWRLLKGPFEYSIESIALDPTTADTVYAGTPTGFYRSLNGGSTWTALKKYWPAQSIAVNPLNPAEVFAAGSQGIVASVDRGKTLTDFNEDLPLIDVNWIALDPAGRIVYAGTEGAGIWRRKF